MNALSKLPDPSALKVVEPEHLRTAATVSEAADALPRAIRHNADVLEVQNVMRRASALYDVVDTQRKAFKGPLDALAKHIQAQAKQVLEPMQSIEAACKKLLADHTLAQERERQKAEREAMERAKAERRETPSLVDPRAETERITRSPAFSPKIPTRTTYVAEVTDHELLPAEYWMVNQALIDERALGGNPIAIPGVTIRKVVSVVNR